MESQQLQIYLVKKQDPNRVYIYLITLTSLSASVGVMGAYSIIKQELASQLGYENSFLGICDGFNFLGHLFGYMYLVWSPIKKPERDFFRSCLLTAGIFSVMPLLTFWGKYSQLALILIHLLMGISKAYWMVPYMIVVQYFDAVNDDKKLVNVWNSLCSFGDIIAIVGLGIAMKQFQISWKVCIWISCAALILISVIQHLTVKEIDTEVYNKQNDINTDMTWQEAKQQITKFFCQPSNFFWTIDETLMLSLYYCVLMWYPYYFIKIGFQYQSIWISIIFPLCLIFGTTLYETLIIYSPIKQTYVMCILVGMNFLLFLIMTFCLSRQNYIWYVVITGLIGLVFGGPYSVNTSSEFYKRCEKAKSFYIPYTVGKIIQILFSIFMMVIIGYFMELNLRSFQYILCLQTGLNFAVHLFRKLYFNQVDQNPENAQAFPTF